MGVGWKTHDVRGFVSQCENFFDVLDILFVVLDDKYVGYCIAVSACFVS